MNVCPPFNPVGFSLLTFCVVRGKVRGMDGKLTREKNQMKREETKVIDARKDVVVLRQRGKGNYPLASSSWPKLFWIVSRSSRAFFPPLDLDGL